MDTSIQSTRNKNLQFLDDLSGYQVHHDDVDPRGYAMRLDSGESIGEVEGLLADVHANLVRYIEVEIDPDVRGRHTAGHYTDADQHALIPVGLVRIDRDKREVFASGMLIQDLIDYPRFTRENGYTTDYEIRTNEFLSGVHGSGSTYNQERYSTDEYRRADRLEDDFYNTDLYDSRRQRRNEDDLL